jgi:hypothetical protein
MTTFNNEAATVNAPVATLAANTDTVGVTKTQAFNLIETLVEDKANWEQTAFKTSNDMLYSLLQRCYGYYLTMCEDSADGKAAREALNDYVSKHNLQFKKSTHNITKIVKCVFGADRRRVSAYSIALRSAHAQKVSPLDIVQFIMDNGGVEEIRLAKSPTALTQKEKIELATQTVTQNVLGKIKSAELSLVLDNSKIGQQIVLIATQGADGELAINAIVGSEAALNAALAAQYSATKKATAETAKAETAKQPQQAAADAVNAAAVKLAA